jgi:hypothetical protein
VPAGIPLRGDRVELDFVQRPAPDLLAVGGRVPAGVHAVAVVADGRVAAVAPVFAQRFWALAPAAGSEFRLLSIDGPPAAARLRTLRR